MPKRNTDKYTLFNGGYYRHSSKSAVDNFICSHYLCTRYLNEDRKWVPKHGIGLLHCPGHLVVYRGAGENGDDVVKLVHNHYCNSTNAIESSLGSRLSRGIPDTRPQLTKIIPNVPHCGLSKYNIASINAELGKAKGWASIVGNTNNDRWYYPKLKDDTKLYKYIEDSVKWYLSEINVKYPALNIISLGLIRSAPYAESQYDGLSQRLHSDYPSNANELDLHLRPLSFIIALDEFDFMYLPYRNAKRCDIITETVRPGEMIVFTNNCLHAGGSNRHSKISNRIFGYVCNNDSDIPMGKVFPYKWSSQDDDALIVEDSGDERIVTESRNGRLCKKPDFYLPN
jgi:hypothetical protein